MKKIKDAKIYGMFANGEINKALWEAGEKYSVGFPPMELDHIEQEENRIKVVHRGSIRGGRVFDGSFIVEK